MNMTKATRAKPKPPIPSAIHHPAKPLSGASMTTVELPGVTSTAWPSMVTPVNGSGFQFTLEKSPVASDGGGASFGLLPQHSRNRQASNGEITSDSRNQPAP